MEIYGFMMLDSGFDCRTKQPRLVRHREANQITRLRTRVRRGPSLVRRRPSEPIRCRTYTPTKYGDLKTVFEFELFGTGVDAGQTTFRLRHAWGELGHFGAGQYWSTFMDPDVFPNQLGPGVPTASSGSATCNSAGCPCKATTKSSSHSSALGPAAMPAGSPIASSCRTSSGVFRAGSSRTTRLRVIGPHAGGGPSAPYRLGRCPGRSVRASGHGTGWGVKVSGNYKISKDTIKAEATYGEGMENYMNDAPVDIGLKNNLTNRITPVLGATLPVFGMSAFYDKTWSDKWTSTAGYSRLDIKNSNGQNPAAFKNGQYALANLLYYPVPDVMVGGEFQWGKRENFSDGFSSRDNRIQFSFRYNFMYKLAAPK